MKWENGFRQKMKVGVFKAGMLCQRNESLASRIKRCQQAGVVNKRRNVVKLFTAT